jgi:murein DD-endopeptidase MepM/ murein hydrolase activator NlpD
VYASADGVVTVADDSGYNGGFGKYLKIAHPNGTETLYAHSMKLLVGAGQAVGKGEKVMLMGTTGRSTGCHLHFEVHGAQNPLAKR